MGNPLERSTISLKPSTIIAVINIEEVERSLLSLSNYLRLGHVFVEGVKTEVIENLMVVHPTGQIPCFQIEEVCLFSLFF